MPWSDGLPAGTHAHSIASSENSRIRVIAGPGTGKSFAMKRRVARLLEAEVDAASILPVTFTRVAAEDLHRELRRLEIPGCDNLEGITLHSLALRMLFGNRVLAATGRVPRPLNEFELKPLICDLKKSHGGKENVKKLIKAYEAAWARLQHDEPGEIALENAAFQVALQQWLRFHKAMLIGEVIPELYRYLDANPEAAERREYSHILVDEFQDLNRVEQGVIRLLSDDADVCIVGDDDQSIYGFKHAHPEGIQEWLDANPGADDLGLDQCRRCPTRVVEMANSLIGNNQLRPIQRTLDPMPGNGEGIVRILQYRDKSREVDGIAALVAQMIEEGTPAGDILVLTQSSKAFGSPLYEALLEREVPTKSYYSETELSHPDAQCAFALLKLLVNREDRVALRWLVGVDVDNCHAAGYLRVREHCEESGCSPWEAFQQLESGALELRYTSRIVAAFREICRKITDLELLPNLAAVVDHLFPADQASTRDIRCLSLKILGELGDEDREAFVRKLFDSIVHPEIPTEVEEVRIMSLHKSKGLSSPVTIIAGCVQGLLPRLPAGDFTPEQCARHLEEQRRLFYVGVTRVKAAPNEGKPGTLILTYSQRMPIKEARSAGITPARQLYQMAEFCPSQFIAELGPSAPYPVMQ